MFLNTYSGCVDRLERKRRRYLLNRTMANAAYLWLTSKVLALENQRKNELFLCIVLV